MEPNEMARLYADAIKNLSRPWLEAGSAMFDANRRWAEAAGIWGDEARAVEEVLARAGRRAGEETRDAFGVGSGFTDVAYLSELQDRVPPRPWTVMEKAVTREIGRPVEDAFQEFDPEPVAAASIAQVHRARLEDGREVAVKVQYPGIQGLIEADLAALEGIFGAISNFEPSVDLQPILSYLRWILPLELDFRREAEAIEELRDAIGYRDDVVIPEVIEGLNTERLLVMELVEGVKITDRTGLENAGLDPEEVAQTLVDVYAEQLFEHGVFHADPHPGNLFVQPGPDGPVLVLLDHGLTLTSPCHPSSWRR